MQRSTLRPALLALALAAGCADIPRFTPETRAADAPWPQLQPIDQVLARAGTVTVSEDDAASLEARAARLRARAARLSRTTP